MKGFKKVIVLILIFSMMLGINISFTEQVEAKDVFTITSPTALQAAGTFDIKWTSAASEGTVKEYTVYVDGNPIGSTTGLSYEYYSVDVKYHTVWVKADYTNGKSAYTATVQFGVSKKGLAVNETMGRNISLKNMGAAWYYNWGDTPNSGDQYQGIEYIPMIWKETSAINLKSRVENAKNQGYKYVLTYNEPDFTNQANMSVNAVYAAWRGLTGVGGIKISSPVTAIWPKESVNWFQDFMSRVKADGLYDADFIAIHCYPENYGGAGMAKWFLEEVVDWTWNTYHKPIWITEFSTQGQYITATGNNGTKEFWQAVMPELDKRDYVERYSAFDFNDQKTGLWQYSTGILSAAGEVYVAQGNPTTLAVQGAATNPGATQAGTGGVKTPDTNNTNQTVTVSKAKINALKNNKKRTVKLTIKKITGVAGYQVRWCDSKNFQGYDQKNIKQTTLTVKKLDKNAKYFFKVRAYKKNGSKKFWGDWSSVKKVKIKK